MTLCRSSTLWPRQKERKKNTTEDFTVGLMGKEVETGKTKLPARLKLMVCVCVCVCYEYELGSR